MFDVLSPVAMATIGGIGALVCYGISDWLKARSSRRVGWSQATMTYHLAGAVSAVVLFFMAPQLPTMTDVLILILTGFLFTVGSIAMLAALRTGSSGVIVPLANTHAIVTIVLIALFLHIPFSALQLLAIVIIVIGALMVSIEKADRFFGSSKKNIVLAILASIFWGSGIFFAEPLIASTSWQMMVAIPALVGAILSFVAYVGASWRYKRSYRRDKYGPIAGVLETCADICLFGSAWLSGSVIIPAVIANASPLVTAIFGTVFDNEKLFWLQRGGTVVIIIGAIVLNII